MKSKYIIFIFFIILIFFLIFVYNFKKSGNNINSKNQENIIEKILQAKEYEAKVKVTVYSNKNENQYELELYENITNNYSREKVLKAKDIEGLEIELDNNKLTISNTKLNLQKVYQDYNPITDNHLFLSNFIKTESPKIEVENNCFIITTKETNNLYLHKKSLYIKKESGLPEKMIIIDEKQNVKVIIEYIEIKFKD